MRKFLLMTTVAAIATIHGAALAQDQSAQPPVAAGQQPTVPSTESKGSSADASKASVDVGPGGSADSAASGGLGDIIVTAQRKVESAQRAAVAIDVVGGSDIANANIVQVGRLGELVPALSVQQVGASSAFFVRGVGNFSVSITNDPAVAFNYDGVYIGRLTAVSSTFFDLDRVEVLKGPQGTLYGRNATAGVINVLPTQPKLGEFSGYATASYGNYNALLAEGAINIPLGEKGAVRISGAVTDRDGYLSDGSSDSKTRAARIQFKSELTSNLTARLAFDYTHLGGVGNSYSYLGKFTATTFTPSGIPRSEGLGSPASQAFYRTLGAGAIGQVRATRDNFPTLFQASSFYGINGEVVWNTGIGTLTVEPAARFDHVRNTQPAGGFPIANDQRDFQSSIETRFAGKAGIIDYTLGFFAYHESAQLKAGSVTFGSNISFVAPTGLWTDSYAPFGRVTANLTPQLRLVGGIRYTHDRKRIDSTSIAISVNCNVPFTCANTVLPPAVTTPNLLPFAIPTASGLTIAGPVAGTSVSRSDVIFRNAQTFTKTTYRGAVEYDVAPASLVYASVETGFRSGGFNNSVGFEVFQPEYITAYTLGSKNRFFDNRLQLNLEAFYWRYRNQQVAHPAFDKGIPPRPNSITENVGRSTIKGVEAEARARVTKTTTLSADVQYLDAENKSFSYSTSAALQPRTGCPSAPAVPATIPPSIIVNCAGFTSYFSPKWTVNLSADQVIPVGNYKITISGDTQFKSKRFLGFEYQPEQTQYSSWTSNAQIAFGPENDRWSVSGFVRNIENDRLLSAPFAFAGVLVGYTTPPRTYGVRGSFKF